MIHLYEQNFIQYDVKLIITSILFRDNNKTLVKKLISEINVIKNNLVLHFT
jgi:hypothetical protein